MNDQSHPTDRLESTRKVVDEILLQQIDLDERRAGFIHLYGVACLAALLALKRGLNPEIPAIAAMLHDISSYRTNDPTDHDRRSAIEAEHILGELNCFTAQEIHLIRHAISFHRLKGQIDGEIDELLKDADTLHHYLYNPALGGIPLDHDRLKEVLRELELGSEDSLADMWRK